jgi:IS5 family transposase
VLRTLNAQPTVWEALLPKMCLGMPAELEAVDALLDDVEFFEPFRAHFHQVLGRPSVPIETYLRLMFLKYRYRLGFEPLCREVADSISWQRFCRIPLGVSVPHPTTLMKITTRCGSAAVEGLNEALLAKAEAARVLKTNRVRADTTVVPADVSYPTDSGLMARGVAKMAKAIGSLKEAGLAPRIDAPDRTLLVRRHARSIGANLRRRTNEAKDEVMAINAKMVRIASDAVREAQRVAVNARRTLRRLGTSAPPKLEAVGTISRSSPGGWPRSSARPVSVWPERSPTEPRGSSPSTIPMPVPSARAGWASRSSSVTRPRSSTTKTG